MMREDSTGGASVQFPALLLRPVLRHRNGVGFITVRSWRAESRAADLRAFKREKLVKTPEVLDWAARDIAAEVAGLFGDISGWCVTCVACGHSRDPNCWGKELARRVALMSGAPFVQVFSDRFVSGASHPKEFSKLPPLRQQQTPDRQVLLVDDVATSGWHIEEAVGLLRRAAPTFAVAWIGGTAVAEKKVAKKEWVIPNPFTRRPKYSVD